MANHYLKALFVFDVAPDEADLVAQAFEAADLLANQPDEAAIASAYADLGPAFAAALPGSADDPFASFRELFDDGDYPGFGCTLERIEGRGDQGPRLWFAGEQVAVDALPRLFARVAPSSLPFAFEYAFDCDRLGIGEFGGGVAIATAEGADWISSRELVEKAVEPKPTLLVLAVRDAERGLAFWNGDRRFGALADAAVFTEAEAAASDMPAADPRPEWMPLPERHAKDSRP